MCCPYSEKDFRVDESFKMHGRCLDFTSKIYSYFWTLIFGYRDLITPQASLFQAKRLDKTLL